MSRLMLIPVAVLLAAGSVVLGPGEQAPASPASDQVQQQQVRVDLVRSAN